MITSNYIQATMPTIRHIIRLITRRTYTEISHIIIIIDMLITEITIILQVVIKGFIKIMIITISAIQALDEEVSAF